ncbi:MAG TPA: hypothetical protein VI603_17375 [Saprospiraceae bacterium]|nr:hypothetical protein [Saprospiraceae bacterium]
MRLKFIYLGVMALFLITKSQAQDTPWDTLSKSVTKIQSDLAALKKLKISGYIQAQAQIADSSGIASFAGGNFNTNTDNRFMVRRGRLKFTYDNKMSQYVLQIDVTEKGIGIKDAYVRFTEPWAKAFQATIGVFDRPFGFEIGYSSGNRETPERGRMSQTIFPGERELGAMLTFQMPTKSKLHFLKIDGGMFNGGGPTASDFDSQKDFIGRIHADKSLKESKIKLEMGVSYYYGGWRQGTSNVYSVSADALGLSAFLQDKDTTNYGAISNRTYTGGDLQLSIKSKIGTTTLRGEYITGEQPGTSSTTASPSSQPTTDTYRRNFNGAYFYFIQDIMKTKHQFVLKYDWYDPNTDISDDDIGKSITAPSGKSFSTTNKQDIAYSTLGIGWTYHWDENVKIVAYYDLVVNEKSKNLAGYSKDLKDNVFTLRVQYKY